MIEELAQVLVIQPLDGFDLDLEAIEDLARPRASLQRDLEGDLPVEAVVPGPKDLAHPTPADPLQRVVSDRPVELGRAERRDGLERLAACRTNAVDPELGAFDVEMTAAFGIGTPQPAQNRVKPGWRVRGWIVVW